MGRLAGFKYAKVIKGFAPSDSPFTATPPAATIWFNPGTNRYTTIPNHPGDVPEGTLRAILKQADIEPDDFLNS